MLYLKRKPGESIIINDDIEIKIIGLDGKNVKLAIDYPKKTTTVFRKEIYKRMQEIDNDCKIEKNALKEDLQKK